MAVYKEVPGTAIPPGVRFDCPRQLRGQVELVEYGGFSRVPHEEGDMYMRVTDRLCNQVTYFKRSDW